MASTSLEKEIDVDVLRNELEKISARLSEIRMGLFRLGAPPMILTALEQAGTYVLHASDEALKIYD